MDENPHKTPKAASSFSFTIRDLLWLVLAAAVACGWWADQRGIREREDELDALINQNRERQARLDTEMVHVHAHLKRLQAASAKP